MKCPNCGGQMGFEDAVCPYCGTPNTFAAQHQSDMAHYRQEYARTQESVIEKTSFMQRQSSWLIILSVLLVGLLAGVILLANSWEIGYSIREQNVARNADADFKAIDALLEQGDYGKFIGYYSANDVSLVRENPYRGLETTAYAYVDLLEYVYALNDSANYQFKPENIGSTCEYIATDLNRIFTIEERYGNDLDQYLPPGKRVYLDDIRDRAAAVSKAYFGLSDKDIEDIPNLSTRRLTQMIEEGIAS